VFVPGIPSNQRPAGQQRAYTELLERLAGTLGPAWQVQTYRHDLVASSRADCDAVVGDLAAHIRQWAGEISEDVEAPDAIIIVGHSFGGVLARAAFVHDVGDGGASRTPNSGRPWTRLVRRIVLLGTPNSGFRWDAPGMPRRWRLAYAFATPWADFAIEKVAAGGYWITDLRIRWLDTFRRLENPPRVVQVLGTRDDLVTRDDILDARFMPNTIEMEIPGATHAGLVDLSTSDDPDQRYAQLCAAVLGRQDEVVPVPEPVHSVPTFFILHGIRDSAYENWVQDLSDAVTGLTEGAEARLVRPDTGYFSAFEFALPGTRKRKIHEFLRLYGDAYATGDPDRFVFAGHSNGTYMMARALDRVPSLRFSRIYLAGTVLPRNFAWQLLVERRQVGCYGPDGWTDGVVRNDRATQDVPVGVLCSWLRGLGSRDVGTAGMNGFEYAPAGMLDGARAYPGGHGAALMTHERLAAIAHFLVAGEGDLPPSGAPRTGFLWLSRLVGNPVVAWTGVLLLLGLIGWVIYAVALAAGVGWAVGSAFGLLIVLWVLLRTI